MLYRFIDDQGTFVIDEPCKGNFYFPLTNSQGTIFSSISPNLSGDIKQDNAHFLTPPVSILDLKNNLFCRREFFLRVDNRIIRLSYPAQDKLELGFLYHKLIKKISSLTVEIINFVPFDTAVEVMWIKIKNNGKALNLTPTSFIPLYGRSESNLRDHRHVSSLLNRLDINRYGILLEPTMIFDEKGHRQNKTKYFSFGFQDNAVAPLGQFATVEYFNGEGDLIYPDAIYKKVKPVNKKISGFDGQEACAAFRFKDKLLKNKEEVNYCIILGISDDSSKIKRIFSKFNSPHKIKRSLEATKRYWLHSLGCLGLNFGQRDYNNWLLWVKFQPTLRKLFGCSFLPHFDYGKGGRGWRDLWQDALTLLLTEPNRAKKIIVNNFKGVRIDGSNATIITKDYRFISDRNTISRVWMDHGVWPYLTLRFYINKTGDLDVLLKKTAYFRDHQLKRGRLIETSFVKSDYLLRTQSGKVYQGSILEHLLIQNLVQFFNVGSHNIIRLENADWNDGLDMAKEKGESVAFSFMYAHNLASLVFFLKKLKAKNKRLTVLKELALLLDTVNKPVDYNNYREKQERLEKYLEAVKNIKGDQLNLDWDELILDLEVKARHMFAWLSKKEWLELRGFFNSYYDNKGRRVEGREGGMMLTGQVFAIMSAVANQEQVRKAWISIKKNLYDAKIGGFRLNTNFGSLYMDLGRAFGFSYGDKENGAFFSHMTIMLANALYKRGFSKEGNFVLQSLYDMSVSPGAKIYPMIPEYFNNQGRGLYHYLTGSASWYIYTLVEEVLGIKFILGDLLLKPALFNNNFYKQSIGVVFLLDSHPVKVIFIRKKNSSGVYKIKEVFLDLVKIKPCSEEFIIRRKDLKKTSIIKVYLG